jgi:hypothetical protein
MNGIEISFITLGFTILIGYAIATIIWALPKLINKLDKSHHHG